MLTHDLDLRGEAGSGTVSAVPARLTLPSCPFARHGLGSPSMPACPGFSPRAVSFTGLGAGETLGEGVSCQHHGVQRGQRGFVSACRHPGGQPAGAEEIAARVREPRLAAH